MSLSKTNLTACCLVLLNDMLLSIKVRIAIMNIINFFIYVAFMNQVYMRNVVLYIWIKPLICT